MHTHTLGRPLVLANHTRLNKHRRMHSKSKRDIHVKLGLVSQLLLFLLGLTSVNTPASAWLVISNAGGVNNARHFRFFLKAILHLKSLFVSAHQPQFRAAFAAITSTSVTFYYSLLSGLSQAYISGDNMKALTSG